MTGEIGPGQPPLFSPKTKDETPSPTTETTEGEIPSGDYHQPTPLQDEFSRVTRIYHEVMNTFESNLQAMDDSPVRRERLEELIGQQQTKPPPDTFKLSKKLIRALEPEETIPSTYLFVKIQEELAVLRQVTKREGNVIAEGGMKMILRTEDSAGSREAWVRGVGKPESAGELGQAIKACEAFRNVPHLLSGHYLSYYSKKTGGLKEVFLAPFMNCDLADFTTQYAPGPENLAKRLKAVLDAAKGLAEMHKVNWCHRDIKPDNILLKRITVEEDGKKTETIEGFLADFDLATDVSSQDPEIVFAGTFGFLAPELYDVNREPSGAESWKRVDIFALGVVLWVVRHETNCIFSQPNPKTYELSEVDMKLNGYRKPGDEQSIDYLIWEMCKPNPAERPKIGEVIERVEALYQAELKINGSDVK